MKEHIITIFDVARYILEQLNDTTAMKLQRLTYYVKAWSLVWDEEELFPEEFQAWISGAISPALYNKHQGMFKVTKDNIPEGDSSKLSDNQKDTIDKVLLFYGQYTAQQLSEINHQEDPWIKARGDVPRYCTNRSSCSYITNADMHEYYSGL